MYQMSWKLRSEVKHVNISSYCTEFQNEVICVKVPKLFLTYSRGSWKWTWYMLEHNIFLLVTLMFFMTKVLKYSMSVIKKHGSYFKSDTHFSNMRCLIVLAVGKWLGLTGMCQLNYTLGWKCYGPQTVCWTTLCWIVVSPSGSSL